MLGVGCCASLPWTPLPRTDPSPGPPLPRTPTAPPLPRTPLSLDPPNTPALDTPALDTATLDPQPRTIQNIVFFSLRTLLLSNFLRCFVAAGASQDVQRAQMCVVKTLSMIQARRDHRNATKDIGNWKNKKQKRSGEGKLSAKFWPPPGRTTPACFLGRPHPDRPHPDHPHPTRTVTTWTATKPHANLPQPTLLEHGRAHKSCAVCEVTAANIRIKRG